MIMATEARRYLGPRDFIFLGGPSESIMVVSAEISRDIVSEGGCEERPRSRNEWKDAMFKGMMGKEQGLDWNVNEETDETNVHR